MTLVERLRDMKMGQVSDVACKLDNLCLEAADEIESLQRKLATAYEIIKTQHAHILEFHPNR